MLRLVLLVLYLIASYSASQTPPLPTAGSGGGHDPDGATFSLPAALAADYGAGFDPDG